MPSDLNRPEPEPTPTEERPVWELVIEDMQSRDQVGRGKYGTPLQASNGRDHLVDAYQEALDLVVYLRAEMEGRASEVTEGQRGHLPIVLESMLREIPPAALFDLFLIESETTTVVRDGFEVHIRTGWKTLRARWYDAEASDVLEHLRHGERRTDEKSPHQAAGGGGRG